MNSPASSVCLIAVGLFALAAPASALNILLVNDDGLSLNAQAQYSALTNVGHDVVVSIPCTNQSFSPNTAPTKAQRGDEAAVIADGKVAVTVMQAGCGANEQAQRRMGRVLKDLRGDCAKRTRQKSCR